MFERGKDNERGHSPLSLRTPLFVKSSCIPPSAGSGQALYERRGFVRSKSMTAQINEVLCKVVCHNICVLIQSIHGLGIEPVFNH
jgi:hypothetical protein